MRLSGDNRTTLKSAGVEFFRRLDAQASHWAHSTPPWLRFRSRRWNLCAFGYKQTSEMDKGRFLSQADSSQGASSLFVVAFSNTSTQSCGVGTFGEVHVPDTVTIP